MPEIAEIDTMPSGAVIVMDTWGWFWRFKPREGEQLRDAFIRVWLRFNRKDSHAVLPIRK